LYIIYKENCINTSLRAPYGRARVLGLVWVFGELYFLLVNSKFRIFYHR